MTKIEDTVRIPPYRFDDPLEEVAIQTLNDTYNGRLDKKLGLLICVNEIEEIGEGRLIMGDGASYHNVVFNAIFFKPEQQEVIDGEVIELFTFHLNFPATLTLVAQNCDKVPLEGKLFYTHDFQVRNDPVNSFPRQTDVQANNVFNHEGNC